MTLNDSFLKRWDGKILLACWGQDFTDSGIDLEDSPIATDV
jgi:hypothetical protein